MCNNYCILSSVKTMRPADYVISCSVARTSKWVWDPCCGVSLLWTGWQCVACVVQVVTWSKANSICVWHQHREPQPRWRVRLQLQSTYQDVSEGRTSGRGRSVCRVLILGLYCSLRVHLLALSPMSDWVYSQSSRCSWW